MKINILLKDGQAYTHYGVIYAIFTGNFLVVTLETNEQIRVPASQIDVFELEKDN